MKMIYNIRRILILLSVISNSLCHCQQCLLLPKINSTRDFVTNILKSQDAFRLEDVQKARLEDPIKAKDHFFETLNLPLQNVCQIIKKIGGDWNSECGFVDGEKFICMELFHEALINGNCLVYSFGLADDWSFEIALANLGNEFQFAFSFSNSKLPLLWQLSTETDKGPIISIQCAF